MKGYKHFINNGGDGLVIYTNGAINISNLVAVETGGVGVYIDNTYGAYLSKPVYNGVNILGNNLFEYNDSSGLEVYSFGAIVVNNITANGNGGAGAYLDNCIYDDKLDDPANNVTGNCFAKTAKPITVKGTNIFNENTFGLDVESAGGAITLSNITASWNTDGGLYADNQWSNAADMYGAGALTINGYGIFNWNGDNGTNYAIGMEAYAVGNAIFKNITANNNDGEGAYVYAWKLVGSANATFTGVNTFNYNGASGFYNGLYVEMDGAIKASNITANGNTGNGAHLYSRAGTTLLGVNTFNDNDGDGLYVDAGELAIGTILLNNITASGNGSDGAVIHNAYGPAANVTLNGVNTFNDNGETGLWVLSNGAILVSNLTAENNGWGLPGGDGAYLNNCDLGNWDTSDPTDECWTELAPKSVILRGPVNVSDNYGNGLTIDSMGLVSMGNVTARWNFSGNGAWINNMYTDFKQNGVTLTGVNNFSENGSAGLEVYTYGMITLNNISANGNDWSGAILDNAGGRYAKGISLLGVNNFNYNGADGLKFMSDGNVILNRVTTIGNDDLPADGYNGSGIYGESTNGTITMTCGFAYGNANGYGVYLDAGPSKLVTLKGLYAAGNGINSQITDPKVVNVNCLLP
jgi:hypothetical protein